ncbi:MAG: zf-HC2 domain-containing protein [Lachnospiraceae bacterium]|nr:zf-HC2 domain-containing protein [Lachnospiraceae bacterium]
MNCDVVKDLIPLYIDECCSEESGQIVREHIEGCEACRKLLEDMKGLSDMKPVPKAPVMFSKINDWKASVLQSALLFLSFALITIGVALEAGTSSAHLLNGFWACNLVIPATGFMLSLANWYFVRHYKNRQSFVDYSFVITLGITLCAYIWACFHYELNLFELFAGCSFVEGLKTMQLLLLFNGFGILFTTVLCILSKYLSDKYAKMLGKE